jgi:hypothetical protein
VNVFLTGTDIHPAAELGADFHDSPVAGDRPRGRGRSERDDLHDVTLDIRRGWFDPSFVDAPIVGDGTVPWLAPRS